MNKKYYYLFTLISILSTYDIFALFERDRAFIAAKQGDWVAAQKLLHNCLAQNEGNPELIYDAAVAAHKSEKYTVANHYFREVIEHPQTSTQLKERALFNCGNCCYKQNQLHEACHYYESTLALNPENIHAQNNLEIVKKMIDEQQKNNQNEKQNNQNNNEKKENSQDSQNKSNNQPDNQENKNNKQQNKNNLNNKDSQENKSEQNSSNQDPEEKLNNKNSSQDTPEQNKKNIDNNKQNQNGQDKPEQQKNNASPENQKEKVTNPDEQKQNNIDKKNKSEQQKKQSEEPQSLKGQQSKTKMEKNNQENGTNSSLDAWTQAVVNAQNERDKKMANAMVKAMVQSESRGNHEQHNNW